MMTMIMKSRAKDRSLLRSAVATALTVVAVAGATACARPKNLDLSLSRATERNEFRVQLASEAAPIPISKLHQWTVHVTGADGLPVSGAKLAVDGGMPEHHHGLPTAPRVEAAATPGDYVIKGMKFSMTGWWVLKVGVATPDGRTDQASFNIVL
jgi:hypothetical protein